MIFIKEKMYLKERVSFNEFYLKRDVNSIQNILKANGFYFSKINTLFNSLTTFYFNLYVSKTIN